MANIGRYVDITIPEYIETILNNMNYQVLTYTLGIGSWLRFIINWLLARINERHIKAFENETALNKDIQNVDIKYQTTLGNVMLWVIDLYNELSAKIGSGTDFIEINQDKIFGLFTKFHKPSADLLLLLQQDVKKLQQDTGGGALDWLNPTWILDQIGTAIGKAVSPLLDLEDDRRNLFEWIWLIFADPPKFFYELTDDIIERYW